MNTSNTVASVVSLDELVILCDLLVNWFEPKNARVQVVALRDLLVAQDYEQKNTAIGEFEEALECVSFISWQPTLP